LLADQAGLYVSKNLSVELLPWESGIVVPERVTANPRILGCAEPNLIMAAQASGAPITALASIFQVSPLSLMTLPETGITTLDQLVGQKVGMHADGRAVITWVQAVRGISPGSIEVVEIPYEHKFDRLLSGELAAIQCYAVDEPLRFAQQCDLNPVVLTLADYGFDAYAQVIFAHNDLLKPILNR
jgi:NitT/TauT family transport system substrate-binding protein